MTLTAARTAATSSLRRDVAQRGPLATAVRLTARPTDRGLVVALIPAHNEEDTIDEALRSLREQESAPDLVVVVADNCTDATARKAAAAGARVFETVDNADRKAGALNQALEQLLPELRDVDAILVMDADSFLEPTFLAEAQRHLSEKVGGVGGVFTGRPGGGYVGLLQRNEYARYARDVARLRGKVRDYGLTRVTLSYWWRQLITFVGVVVTATYLLSLAWSFAVDGAIHLHPLWLGVTGVFVAERVVTVRARGPLQMALAATLAFEMAFDIFLQGVHAKALWDTLTHKERTW